MTRNSNSIDAASRALNVEVDVDNANGRIKPGAYGFGQFTIPANTLLFRSEGLRVGVVKDGHVHLVPVRIGRDFGDRVEVVSGLGPDDQVRMESTKKT